MKNIKNKHGDIPITILVLGVILICMATIFSFYFASQGVKNGLNSVGVIQKAAVTMDKIALYKNLAFTSDQIDKAFSVQQDSIGKYINFSEGGLFVRYYLSQ